nr:histidine phosphatase family protein [Fundidesulfovibrio agrisoli]
MVRHGRTAWNEERRIQGRADSPLTEDGAREVAAWPATLAGYGFSALYSSPIGRAALTAEALGRGLGLSVRMEPGLVEQEFGSWTGLTVPELRSAGLLAPQEAAGWAFTPPGGEARTEVLARSWEALSRLGRAHEGRSILAVTHEGVVRAVLYALLGRDYLPTEPKILAPRALHLLRAEGGCLAIEAMNLPL